MILVEKPSDVLRFVAVISAIAILTTLSANAILLDTDTFIRTRLVSLVVAVVVAVPVSLIVSTKLLEIHRLNQRLTFLADHDQLTRVMTRENFFRHFEGPRATSGTTLMVDIDRFKQINDTHGHFAGDEVLKHVSQILLTACRSMDRVCRFGGEEFIIFLDGAEPAEGLRIAERIRDTVESTPSQVADKEIPVTISIGVAHKPAGIPIDIVLQSADAALYRAKESGRNRIQDSPPARLSA